MNEGVSMAETLAERTERILFEVRIALLGAGLHLRGITVAAGDIAVRFGPSVCRVGYRCPDGPGTVWIAEDDR